MYVAAFAKCKRVVGHDMSMGQTAILTSHYGRVNSYNFHGQAHGFTCHNVKGCPYIKYERHPNFLDGQVAYATAALPPQNDGTGRDESSPPQQRCVNVAKAMVIAVVGSALAPPSFVLPSLATALRVNCNFVLPVV